MLGEVGVDGDEWEAGVEGPPAADAGVPGLPCVQFDAGGGAGALVGYGVAGVCAGLVGRLEEELVIEDCVVVVVD